MIRGYIIERFTDMGGAYTCARLVSEASAAGMRLDVVGVHDSILCASGRLLCGGEEIRSRDFVINRYKWGHLRDVTGACGCRQYNPAGAFTRYVDKYNQLVDLRSEAFDVPRYVLATSSPPFEEVVEAVGLPFVAKGLASSMGREIRLISSRVDYDALAHEFGADKEWIFEEYIACSRGRDMRLMAVRGEAVACMQRRSSGDFRANVALGAEVTAVTVNSELRTIARDVCRVTGLDVVGIDLLFGNLGPVLCEINVMPGLEGIESATGVNVAGRIISMIREDFLS